VANKIEEPPDFGQLRPRGPGIGLCQHAADDPDAEMARDLDAMLGAVHDSSDDGPELDN
jgi:hypothetical protein